MRKDDQKSREDDLAGLIRVAQTYSTSYTPRGFSVPTTTGMFYTRPYQVCPFKNGSIIRTKPLGTLRVVIWQYVMDPRDCTYETPVDWDAYEYVGDVVDLFGVLKDVLDGK